MFQAKIRETSLSNLHDDTVAQAMPCLQDDSVFYLGKQVNGDICYWKPGKQARNGFVEGGEWFSFGQAEQEVILGHRGKDICKVVGNKNQELTRETQEMKMDL